MVYRRRHPFLSLKTPLIFNVVRCGSIVQIYSTTISWTLPLTFIVLSHLNGKEFTCSVSKEEGEPVLNIRVRLNLMSNYLSNIFKLRVSWYKQYGLTCLTYCEHFGLPSDPFLRNYRVDYKLNCSINSLLSPNVKSFS